MKRINADFHSWWSATAGEVSLENEPQIERTIRMITDFHSWWSATAGEVSSENEPQIEQTIRLID